MNGLIQLYSVWLRFIPMMQETEL